MHYINIPGEIKVYQEKIRQLEKIQENPELPLRLQDYYRCRQCGRVCRMVQNEYAQQGFCANCWSKKLQAELKAKVKDLIGAKVVDFEIEAVDAYGVQSIEEVMLTKLVLETEAGERRELKTRFMPLRI